MIFYNTTSWTGLVLRWKGTVWARIWWKVCSVFFYSLAAYAWCTEQAYDLGHTRKNILGPTLAFLLVFRANDAYKRYWHGRTVMTKFFTDLRDLMTLYLQFCFGGERNKTWLWRQRTFAGKPIPSSCPGPPWTPTKSVAEVEQMAPHLDDAVLSEERTHMIRWVIVLAISLQLFARVQHGLLHGEFEPRTQWLLDWDRCRIRHLTSPQEFRRIDYYITTLMLPEAVWDEYPMDSLGDALHRISARAPGTRGPMIEANMTPTIRLPVVIVRHIASLLHDNFNDNKTDKTYGFIERYLPNFSQRALVLLRSYAMLGQCVGTPLPFPYYHLCKIMIWLYFMFIPFFISHELGFVANVGEMATLALALFGLDAIAIELENPFGDDVNDLDFYERIAALEQEAMMFVRLLGDNACERNFTFTRMPPEIAELSDVPNQWFLALTTQIETDGEDEHVIVGGPVARTKLRASMEVQPGVPLKSARFKKSVKGVRYPALKKAATTLEADNAHHANVSSDSDG